MAEVVQVAVYAQVDVPAIDLHAVLRDGPIDYVALTSSTLPASCSPMRITQRGADNEQHHAISEYQSGDKCCGGGAEWPWPAKDNIHECWRAGRVAFAGAKECGSEIEKRLTEIAEGVVAQIKDEAAGEDKHIDKPADSPKRKR